MMDRIFREVEKLETHEDNNIWQFLNAFLRRLRMRWNAGNDATCFYRIAEVGSFANTRGKLLEQERREKS